MTERMTTHEGAPNMPTHPEVVTLDPTSPDDMARLGRAATNADKQDCPRDADFGINVFRLLTAPPLPEEPPLYTVVHVPTLNRWQRWTRLNQPTGRNWVDNRADWSSWEQVCALGTPEVLEPDSVKALREQVETLSGWVKNAEKQRDEARARLQRVREAWRTWPEMTLTLDKANAEMRRLWELLRVALNSATEDEPAEPAPVEVTEEPQDEGAQVEDCDGDVWERSETGLWFRPASPTPFRRPWATVEQYGPLTLVETGGQS